jgi:hypothetical protein
LHDRAEQREAGSADEVEHPGNTRRAVFVVRARDRVIVRSGAVALSDERRQELVARLALAAPSRAVDRVTVEVVQALRGAGVRALVLKGPVFGRWLYGDDEVRTYVDSDLLIDPENIGPTAEVMLGLGFRLPTASKYGTLPHSQSWARDRGREELVDLHTTIVGATARREVVWAALSRGAEPFVLAGAEVEGTGSAASALTVALHAAAHGIHNERTRQDLQRALERADVDTWRATRDLATEVGAEESFAAGLRTLPAGAALAATLDLTAPTSVEVILRAQGFPRGTAILARLRAAGWRSRGRLVTQAIVPDPAYMREWSAKRGRSGEHLAVAYVRRIVGGVPIVGRSLRAVVAARRRERSIREENSR